MTAEFIEPEDLELWCHKTIDFLREDLKLKPHQCYVVLKVLLDEFPKEEIPTKVYELIKR